MKEKLTTSVRILEIKPDAVYQEKTYTQYVVVEFENGKQIELFNPRMRVMDTMVGKTIDLVVSMLVLSLARNEKGEPIGIADQTAPAIVGRIVTKIVPDYPDEVARRYRAVIDFGVGTILIEIDKKYFHLRGKKVTSFSSSAAQIWSILGKIPEST